MDNHALVLTDLQKNIEQQILHYIFIKGLKKGDRLPSHEEFVRLLGVSRAALREALARLERGGVVEKLHGVGTFVAEDIRHVQSSTEVNLSLTEMIRAMNKVPGSREVEVRVQAVPPDVSVYFDEPNETALLVDRVKTADGLPFAYCVSYLNLEIPNLETRPEAYAHSIYQYLHDHCNEFISDSDAEIEAILATDEIAQKLDIPAGAPVLKMRQRHYNKSGKTLIVSTEYFVQNQLKLRVHRHRPWFD